MKSLRSWGLFLAIALVDLSALFWNPPLAASAGRGSGEFLLEILGILPPVILLLGLFDAWVPRKLVEDNIGPRSGAKGMILSIVLGSLAAGPLFAAFPVALSLRRKGARIGNIAIFLGSWGSIKVPMILLEASYLGLRFSLLRTGLTILGILATSWILERMVPESSLPG